MLIFTDWTIKSDGGLIARQYDNLSRELVVIGDIPDGYTWEILVEASGNFNVISLTRDQDGLSVSMTAEMLALTGTYAMQLRGTAGETVKHTNVVQVYVPESMSGDAVWPSLPSEFSQAEERIRELNEHPPIPGNNGFWLLWNPETKQYEESDLPLPSGGGGGTTDYNALVNKPTINGVEVKGALTTDDLKIPPGEQGPQGEPGPAGADGKTPERGVDYWTESDKQEIVDEVIAEVGGGGSVDTLSADKVIYPKDVVITAPVGVHTIPAEGYKVIKTTGLNMTQVIDTLFSEEKNPSVTQPSASITLSGAGAKEAGTKVTPSWSASLNPGAYQYGPATGVAATAWAVTDTKSNSGNTQSGSFPELQVTDGINYRLSLTVSHGPGVNPVTNLGNEYPAGQIQAGSKTAASGSITAFRNTFWGTLTDKSATPDSAVIRGLPGKSNAAYSNGRTFTIPIPVGALRVVFAYPATLREVTSVLDVNGLNAEIKTAFTQYTVNVEGANGYTAISYRVYVLDFANPNDTANTYKVTI